MNLILATRFAVAAGLPCTDHRDYILEVMFYCGDSLSMIGNSPSCETIEAKGFRSYGVFGLLFCRCS